MYAGFSWVSGFADLIEFRGFLTSPPKEDDIRHAVRELYCGHCGQEGERALATPFDSVYPVRSVIIPLRAHEVYRHSPHREKQLAKYRHQHEVRVLHECGH